MYVLYSLLLALGFVLALPFFIWKGLSSGKYFGNLRARLGGVPEGLGGDGRGSVWIHAVSVGEVLVARPLVAALKQRLPGRAVYVSTTTMTGQAVAQAGLPAADGILYAPFDWPGPVRRTLAALNPDLLVLVETELWPNLIHEARRGGSRVAVVNGRLSPRSFERYRLVRRWLRRVLEEVDLFLMQSEPHAQRIRALGAPEQRVRVTGNLKFDALPAEGLAQGPDWLPAGTRDRPLWVAGSTVAGEEAAVLRAFRAVRARVPHAALVVAPRHPERFAEIPPLVEAACLRGLRRSRLEGPWRDGEVLLLDTLGELAQVYHAATVVFVGGSLVPAGGHNILEPAVAGRAIVVGPHMENFQEVADQFRAESALVQVRSADELGSEVTALMLDEGRRQALGERARALALRNRGALARTVDALAGLVA